RVLPLGHLGLAVLVGGHLIDQQAVVGLAGEDGVLVVVALLEEGAVAGHDVTALGDGRLVAALAVLGEEGADVAVVADGGAGPGGLVGGGRGRGGERQRQAGEDQRSDQSHRCYLDRESKQSGPAPGRRETRRGRRGGRASGAT